MGPKWSHMVPNDPPLPSPSPASAKVSCQGAKQIETNVFWWFPFFFDRRSKTNPFLRYCLMSKGVLTKTTAAVFPTGFKKRKSNNDDKHDQGQAKRSSSTLCWGNKNYRPLMTHKMSHKMSRTIEANIAKQGSWILKRKAWNMNAHESWVNKLRNIKQETKVI